MKKLIRKHLTGQNIQGVITHISKPKVITNPPVFGPTGGYIRTQTVYPSPRNGIKRTIVYVPNAQAPDTIYNSVVNGIELPGVSTNHGSSTDSGSSKSRPAYDATKKIYENLKKTAK